MKLASLHIYPVKSCRAIDLDISAFNPLGLLYDRRWVVVEKIDAGVDGAEYRFISQRSHPRLAQLIAKPSSYNEQDGLSLEYQGRCFWHDINSPVKTARLSIWNDTFEAPIYFGPTAAWLSECFGGNFALASLSGTKRERFEPDVRANRFDVSFADAYPVLIATTGSLAALNRYVQSQTSDQGLYEAALPMARFRPNIVIDTDAAWAEDSWKRIKIGKAVFECVKPCSRCIMTTLDPLTGESKGDASLRSLARLRRSGDRRVKGFLFGTNAIPLLSGEIKIGDKAEVLEWQEPWEIASN